MIAIGHYQPPVRRNGLLGVHSIGEFVLTVPEVETAQQFYDCFGLEVRADGNSLGLHSKGDGYRWGRVIAGPRKAMQHVSFHCFEEDLGRSASTPAFLACGFPIARRTRSPSCMACTVRITT